MSVALGYRIQVRSNAESGLVVKPCGSHQLNAVAALSRVGMNRRARVSRGLVKRKVGGLDNRFIFGMVVRGGAAGLCKERFHFWRMDGPGQAPKLVIKNALSQVPEKPLGLYDPSLDKDLCGVELIAELSCESSRKMITDAIEMLLQMSHRGLELSGTEQIENNTNAPTPRTIKRRFSIPLPWLLRGLDSSTETINSGGAGDNDGGNNSNNNIDGEKNCNNNNGGPNVGSGEGGQARDHLS